MSEGNYGAELDAIPPKVNEFYDDLSLGSITSGGEAELKSDRFAVVPAGQSADLLDCLDLTATKAITVTAATVGQKLCLETDAGRMALVVLDKINSDSGTVDISVKVWEK